MNCRGTPTTLEGAILNGISMASDNHETTAKNIRKHVQDFLAQKFAVSLLRTETEEASGSIENLWKALGFPSIRKE